MEKGRVISTKKGWEASRAIVGEMPNPASPFTQKPFVSHRVIVSGMRNERFAEPEELQGQSIGKMIYIFCINQTLNRSRASKKKALTKG